MNICEHNEKIIKFCITEHCHHKQAGGCNYCMKKYHFHLSNINIIQQSDIQSALKKLTFPSQTKFKSRSFQESVYQHLKNVKNAINAWFQSAQNQVVQKLSYPSMKKQGILPTFQRIKNKQYKKLNPKDLKSFYEYSKNTDEYLKKQEIESYLNQIQWASNTIKVVDKLVQEFINLPTMKETDDRASLSLSKNTKLTQTLESILKEKQKLQKGPQVIRNNYLSRQQQQINKVAQAIKSSSLKRKYERQNTPSKMMNTSLLANPNKIVENSKKPEQQLKPVEVVKQKTETQPSKLKRRRSSIDESMNQFKFGKQKLNKNNQQQVTQKSEILLQKTKQNDKSTTAENKSEQSFRPSSTQKKQQQKQQSSKQQVNILGLLMSKGINPQQWSVMNNILPPPKEKQKKITEQITNKVIKMPLNTNKDKAEQLVQIQSPIFKRRRQVQGKNPGGFNLNMNNIDPTLAQLQKKDQPKEDTKDPAQLKKQQEKKEQLFQLQKNEKNSLLLFNQALKSQSQRAIELLRGALKYSSNNLSAAQYLSYLYLQNNKPRQCLQVCQSILIMIEDTPQEFQLTMHLHNNKAAALNLLGRYSESIVILQKCLKNRRKHYFYKNLGDAYFGVGISQKAITNYQNAVRLDPGYDEAFYNLAVAQYIQHEYSSAFLNIKQALLIDNTNQTYTELKQQISRRQQSMAS